MKDKMMLVFLFFAFVVACSDNQNEESADLIQTGDDSGADVAQDHAESEVELDDGEAMEDSAANEAEVEAIDTAERMIVYNGHLIIDVERFQEAQDQIQQSIDELNGFVVESSVQDEGDGEVSGTFAVRVPEENFTPFLDQVESLSLQVVERMTTGEDVTEEYVDLESRLRSHEAVEERQLVFMEDADTTEDLLSISNDLANTQEQIETIQGRINYLDHQVTYALVNINVRETAGSTLTDQTSLNTWGQASNMFTDTINVLMSIVSGVVVFVIGLSPVLVPLLLIGLAIFIYWRKNKKTGGAK
ncbi:DUF4349 domain-containing protein [Geomicrobium sp. JCM 19039]|uniref:DUF4349 domain-containing protein n=1 Tax=Geomicrobium sp. JCM 19039 TaxID=1460636 RepID=UPI00045F3C35|nr:DUF4349 domain-containing protein [Geomicrobium sp. JCM 19039]GAK12296.1 hypothetical protein JCM19039_2056 [Geomicrobium sp. JCM 19039]